MWPLMPRTMLYPAPMVIVAGAAALAVSMSDEGRGREEAAAGGERGSAITMLAGCLLGRNCIHRFPGTV